MYRPAISNASYVEIFNSSTISSFDLANWRVDGLEYSFRSSTLLTPRSFLVLAKSRSAYLQAFPTNPPPFAEFIGNLDPNGETLALIKPGTTPALDTIVDKVHYESQAPWPVAASGQGAALQLIDSSQDNARVSNWSDGLGWHFISRTNTSASQLGTNLFIFLQGPGQAYIDDVSLVPTNGP